MSDVALAAARTVAATWEEEAAKRRAISRHDPVADTLSYCAADLVEQLRVVDAPGAMRTVEQFATDACVTPQCVRNWINRGELTAMRTPHGWRIPRTASRRRPSRSEGAAP